MPESNPTLLRRMLVLRQFPMFATAELAELAVVAENVVETTFPAGSIIAPAAPHQARLHLVLDGRIERGRAWGPRQMFGALEVLAGVDASEPAIAAVETRTLHLAGGDLAELLEDNFGVLLAVLRELATRVLALGAPPAPPVLIPSAGAPLGLVDRLIVLRQQALFAGARLQGLAMLAHASEELRWAPGTIAGRAGELPASSLLVVEGALRCQLPDGAYRELAPGSTVGTLETLAGAAHTTTIEAVAPVRVLRSDATAILDMLEDHPDVGLSMIQRLARALVAAPPSAEPN